MEKAYFVVFERQDGQTKDAYSVVRKTQLTKIKKTVPIKAQLEIPNKEIYTKEELKKWLHELGGVWYGDN